MRESRAANGEAPTWSRGDKKRHHFKLAQLLDCETRYATHPPPPVCPTQALLTLTMSMRPVKRQPTEQIPLQIQTTVIKT